MIGVSNTFINNSCLACMLQRKCKFLMLKIMPRLILECQISLNFSAAKLEMQFRYQNKKYYLLDTFRKYRYIYHVLFFLLKSTSYSWAFRSAQRASRRVSCARTHKSLVLTFSELLWIKHEPESVKNQN